MPSILVIDDKESMRGMLAETLSGEGYDVDTAADGRAGINRAREKKFDVVLTDLKLPEMDGIAVLSQLKEADPDLAVIVMTAFGTIETAVEAMKLGAVDFIAKPFDTDRLGVIIKKALENRRLVAENALLREELDQSLGFSEIVGRSEKMVDVSRLIQKVAPSDTTALLLGESGTGKELFARAIHNLSPRKSRPFVAINCAAIPSELLENELFGSERGAFTGAVARKMGKFEIGEGGTVFLDEIGDMSPALQSKLLRVLQEKTFERLGGTKLISVDVRVIAASNVDLKEAIDKKTFREDLYYRLSVFPIKIPPLRERREDIPNLTNHFIRKFCLEMKKPVKSLSQDAFSILDRYHWPGNVRELENTIERAIILCEGKKITPEHLAIRIPTTAEIRLREGAGLKEVSQFAQMEAERGMIVRVLTQTRGNKRKAAEILKIDYTTLFEKIKKYNLQEEI
ncbi:MAG: sigma-54 dependent transcriptional regulator [candidate division Zixibacteria bacterium]|nr:sigma-54 dependent transcriptional regulator [candidate division Zixibacteria bacterium]MCI0597096.1 sigma-54 dependent transcriptional regulator [candidate division Zixibacteria bacterium]